MGTHRYPVALTIAGSDSGGGAGIEADLKTFVVFGVHGTAAITSVTAQNTRGVFGVYDLPPEAVTKQIEVVVEDIGVDAAKTGMLSNKDIIVSVANVLKKYDFPLVIDPVMVAKSGDPLLREDAVESLTRYLFPRALLITPNRMEAEKLYGSPIKTLSDAEKAARIISREYGVEAVIVKGGHLEGDKSIDILYYKGRTRAYTGPRILQGCYHGTGCSFSAAITANLALGYPLEEAISIAKRFITLSIRHGLRIGSGHCPVNPVAWLEIDAEKHRVEEELRKALDLILENEDVFYEHIPEVGTNIAMALPSNYASSIDDIAAIDGRIIRTKHGLVSGPIEWGASSHMARLILTAMRYDPRVRAAINLKYSEDLVERLKRSGLDTVYIDRESEPVEVAIVEGRSIPWIMEAAIHKNNGRVPSVIYDTGSRGREAMVRILGPSIHYIISLLLNILH